jgi:hypothetical protein
VTEAYDQSGNGYNVTQATAGSQPQLLPSFLNGLPGILGTGGGQFIKVATFATIAQPISMSTVLARTSNFTTKQVVIANGNLGVGLQWAAAANIITMAFGGNGNATMSDSAWHALQVVANSTSSFLNVDGTDTPESVGSTGMTAASGLTWFCEANGVAGANNAGATEMGIWPLGFNSTQRGSLHSNQSAYWGTP